MTLGNILINSHSLFDRTFAYYSCSERISRKDRSHYKIHATDIRKGSIIIDTKLMLDYAQSALPLLTSVSPQLLWETTSTAFGLLLKIYSSLSGGTQPKIEITDSPGAVVNYFAGNDNTYLVSQTAYEVAKHLKAPTRRLSDNFRNAPEGVLAISSPNSTSEPIKLTSSTAKLFQSQKVVSDTSINLHGFVKSFHNETRTGEFWVPPGMAIPENKYLFAIAPNEEQDTEFIDSLKGKSISVRAQIEYDVIPSLDSKINRLILAINKPNVA